MSAPRRVLGIDPGSRITGFGVVDLHGQHRQYVASGCIRAPEGAPLPERIRAILDGIAEVTRLHQPTEAAVEQVFVNVNPASTLLLGQARGAALSALVLANLPIAEYTALQVKQSVVGNGHAGKEQVQAMVVRLLKLNGTPQADAADALAVALCHANHSQRLASAARAIGLSAANVKTPRCRQSWASRGLILRCV